MSIDKAINNACASLEMEGMNVSDELKTLLVKKLNNEISTQEYIQMAMELQGVKI